MFTSFFFLFWFFYVVFFSSFHSFVLLILIEFLLVCIFFMILCFGCSWFLSLVFLFTGICMGSFGVSLYVSCVRLGGGNYVLSFSSF